jgi:hypothetical protein
MADAEHVTIVAERVEALALEILSDGSLGVAESIKWDADGWHYLDDAQAAGPLTCQYIIVLDALNFCFWPTPGRSLDRWRYPP